jgi:hypothetical protein
MTAAVTTRTVNLFPHEDEEFIEIIGFENSYLVSTYGRVFSLRRRHFMKPQIIGGGVPRIALSAKGGVVSLPLAPTVLTAFGKRPPRPNAMPKWADGDTNNCALGNLSWA